MSRRRALSLRAAAECENARHPQCKCRCGGAFHGAARVQDPRTLPLADPHSPSTVCGKCKGTGKRTYWGYDSEQGCDVQMEVACFRCKGAGRILTQAVKKAALQA